MDDELAFPLLLRGLQSTDVWLPLNRADIINPNEAPLIYSPQVGQVVPR